MYGTRLPPLPHDVRRMPPRRVASQPSDQRRRGARHPPEPVPGRSGAWRPSGAAAPRARRRPPDPSRSWPRRQAAAPPTVRRERAHDPLMAPKEPLRVRTSRRADVRHRIQRLPGSQRANVSYANYAGPLRPITPRTRALASAPVDRPFAQARIGVPKCHHSFAIPSSHDGCASRCLPRADPSVVAKPSPP